MSKTAILITGATGRMGRALIETIAATPDLTLVGAIERPNHPQIGENIGQILGIEAQIDVKLTTNIEDLISLADVIVDFSHATVSIKAAEICARASTALVIGTTGFSESQCALLKEYAQKAPILRAGNMSLGINLLEHLTQQCAERLGHEFDIEIIESHHRFKRDAPSGTALMLGQAAAKGRGQTLDMLADYARHGHDALRATGTIGFHAIRGGDIVGEHDIIFAADGERIILRHIATKRTIFVRGALQAARWLKGRAPRSYKMNDIFT